MLSLHCSEDSKTLRFIFCDIELDILIVYQVYIKQTTASSLLRRRFLYHTTSMSYLLTQCFNEITCINYVYVYANYPHDTATQPLPQVCYYVSLQRSTMKHL